jgi:hypothetical protein
MKAMYHISNNYFGSYNNRINIKSTIFGGDKMVKGESENVPIILESGSSITSTGNEYYRVMVQSRGAIPSINKGNKSIETRIEEFKNKIKSDQ